MPRRATPPLSLPRRRALAAELTAYAELKARAEMDEKVHVSRCYDAGMSLREIGEVLGVSADTSHRWRNEGEQERARRRAEAADKDA